MLSTTERQAYFTRHKLSPLAQRVIQEVRGSPPSRRVKSGAANVACRFASRKMGMVIQAESHKNELPAVLTWEHDDATHEFYDQPPKIKLEYRAKNGRFVSYLVTPDFLLLQEGFAGWVECKTEEWLQGEADNGSPLYVKDGDGRWRCPPAERYAASVGLGFRVRSSAETNWAEVRNIEFLSDYLDERCPAPKPEDLKRVRGAFGGQAWILLKELIESDAGQNADTVYKMVADGLLQVDLGKDLLTEPERTLVFRDRLAAEAHRIHLESMKMPAVPAFRPVAVAPGQSMLWDGKPWRVLNVGDDEVFLEDADKILSSLRRPVLEQMVRDGIVKGLPEGAQPNRDKAEQTVRAADPSDFKHALYRFHCLFPEKASGAPPTACDRAIRKWRALYRKGAELFGSGFLGLLPKIHSRGNRARKLDDSVIEIMNEVIDELFAKPGQRSLVSCWGDARNTCKERGLIPPSESAFRNEVRDRRANELKEAREGEKAAYSGGEFQWRLDRTTPRHGERPLEIGHIDHTELDLQFIGSRRGEPLGRAWLTVLIDAYTRMVLAWVIMFEEPSQRSCMSVIRECIRRHGRVPKYIVVDKGAEFQSVYFECLLARLDCHKKTRPASKPRFGSIIERFFGMSNEAFIHNLVGNNQALQKPRQMSKSHDPRRLAIWTLPEFQDAFEGFLDKVYSEMQHSALGMSPKEAMAVGLAQSGMRKHALIPYTQDLVVMCLPTTPKGTATVDQGRGVKIGYIYYWTPAFRDPAYFKQELPIRYDPFDASVAFIWLLDRWVLCRSEYAAEFHGRSEREIKTATSEIKARTGQTGKRRCINAALIAKYLRETTATENVLTKRKQQQELLQAHDLRAVCAPQTPVSSDETPIVPSNAWSDLKLKFFGDFA